MADILGFPTGGKPVAGEDYPVGMPLMIPTGLVDPQGEDIIRETVVSRVVKRHGETWRWAVMWDDGSPGELLYGTRDKQTSPIGMTADNKKRVLKARCETLVMVCTVESPEGDSLRAYFPVPYFRGQNEAMPFDKLTT